MGKTFKTILNALDELGYSVSWNLLDCKDFGVPQSRKRVFIVGTLTNKVNLDNFEKNEKPLSTILETGKPIVDSDFTTALLKHYEVTDLYGKAIKDKRGGKNNIHSWDFGLKGEISDAQKELLEKLFKD